MLKAREARQSIKRLLAALRRELESLDADLDDRIRKSRVWQVRETLLTSVPGVEPTVARHPESPNCPNSAASIAARSPRSPGATMDQAIGQMAWPQLHQRRQEPRARSPLHGRPRRIPPEPLAGMAFRARLPSS